MKILVTGAAGFIGFCLIRKLQADNHQIVGLDNINTYYDTRIKFARLAELGFAKDAISETEITVSQHYSNVRFVKMELSDRERMDALFTAENFDCVVNLAGQAGVRYSIENPFAYAESNLMGFLNILENCRHHAVNQLLYASSSSVYGEDTKVPFSETAMTDSPVSLYAATKKANELMAYSYSKLYGIPATGLRFFTVYGPWGRPDMAPFLFLRAILHGEPIRVFNNGNLSRDFTFIDDIIAGIISVMNNPPQGEVPHRVYNIGNSKPVALMDFISTIERVAGREAVKIMTEMQKGDVHCTYADVSKLQRECGYSPKTDLADGIQQFYDWYIEYCKTFETQ